MAKLAVQALVGAFLGGLLIAVWHDFVQANHAEFEVIEAAILLLPLLIVVIAVHESGHALAAKLVGWRVHGLFAGPCWIRFEAPAVRFMRSFGLGGATFTVPASPRRFTRTRRIIVFAAGPLANLVCALALFVRMQGAIAETAVYAFGLISLLTGLVNALPRRLKSAKHADGMQIVRLLTSTVGSRRDYALMLLSCQLMTGVPVCGWDRKAIAVLEDQPSEDLDGAAADIILFNDLFEHERYSDAKRMLDRATGKLSSFPRMQEDLFVADAYLAAVGERNPSRAKEALGKVQRQATRKSYPYMRANAAMLLSAGNVEELFDAISRARRSLRSYFPFLWDGEREVLDKMVAEARSMQEHVMPQAAAN